jgi:hypothetical protein
MITIGSALLLITSTATGVQPRRPVTPNVVLIIDGAVTRVFLFNAKADPGERVDWFSRRPDIVRRLQQLLTDWERDVDLEAKAFAAKLLRS